MNRTELIMIAQKSFWDEIKDMLNSERTIIKTLSKPKVLRFDILDKNNIIRNIIENKKTVEF